MQHDLMFPRDLVPLVQAWLKHEFANSSASPSKWSFSDDLLQKVFEIAFHASLLTEEGRRSDFGLVLLHPNHDEDLSTSLGSLPSYRRCRFTNPRPLTVTEVNKVAPTANADHMLIAVWHDTENQPVVEGLVDIGFQWHKFVTHQSSQNVILPPHALTVTSRAPGELEISYAGRRIAMLQHGTILQGHRNARDTPLFDFLSKAAAELTEEISQQSTTMTKATVTSPHGYQADVDYVLWLLQVLRHIRSKRHGGTVILVPSEMTLQDTRITDRLNIKYPVQYDYARSAFLRHTIGVLHDIDANYKFPSNATMSTADYWEQDKLRTGRERFAGALNDIAQAIASLTAIDGAVVMTDRFEVLGFGAEVIVSSPTLTHVLVDAVSGSIAVPIERYGTRHRSAFRFCSSLAEAMAFVISQDGGAKAIKRIGSDVIVWPNIDVVA